MIDSWTDKRGRPLLAIFLLSLAGAVAVSLATGVPRPGIADEFSYLLAADTYSHFRLTNPPHPLWTHFETFWVLHQPTYSPKYPPGQGLVLAFGQLLGHPVIGVWLSAAAMCAAITWMLRAWVPPRWAFFGGLLVALKFGTSGVWAQSYMGGAVAAAGGALLFGALRRILEQPRPRNALWLGVGLVVLANSRPYEGFVVSIPAAAVLLVWLARQSGSRRRRAFLTVVLPLIAVLALGASWTLAHNRTVTGNAFQLPYQLHMKTYPFVKAFVWQKAPTGVEYRPSIFTAFEGRHRWSEMQGNPPGIRWRAIKRRFGFLRTTFLPGYLWTPLLLLPLALRDRWTFFALGSCLFMLGGQILTVPAMPYASAPATALLFLLFVQSVRAVSTLRIGRLRAAPVTAILVLGLFLFNSVAQARKDNSARWSEIHTVRPQIEADLEASGARHVVIVRYGSHHDPNWEWTYNSADIDSQKVIWAQDRGDILNRRLMDYFSDRQIWILDLGFEAGDHEEAWPEPYAPSGSLDIRTIDLLEVLSWVAEGRDPQSRSLLLDALFAGNVDGSRRIAPDTWVAGTYGDGWTRGSRPAVLALRNRGPEPVAPTLRLGCLAPSTELPVTVRIQQGRRVREATFTNRREIRLRLRRMAPGESSLVVVSTDKAWQPEGNDGRRLGVNLRGVILEAQPERQATTPGRRAGVDSTSP